MLTVSANVPTYGLKIAPPFEFEKFSTIQLSTNMLYFQFTFSSGETNAYFTAVLPSPFIVKFSNCKREPSSALNK